MFVTNNITDNFFTNNITSLAYFGQRDNDKIKVFLFFSFLPL